VVAFIKTRKVSERRGCRLASINRKSCRYRKKRTRDESLIERLRQLALRHPYFGYRRIAALLRRAGERVNLKRVYRLWKQQKLSLPKTRARKRRVKSVVGVMPKATRANQVWTYDFVFDQSLSGKSLKMLTLIDEYTRECLAVEVGVSIKGERVRQILQRVCADMGKPEQIRSDNGSEFISTAVGGWLTENDIKPLFIEPGKPWQNGKCESLERQTTRRMPEPRMVLIS